MNKLQHYATQYLAPFYDYVTGRKPAPNGDYFAFSYSSIAQLAKSPLHFFVYVVESKFEPQPDAETDAQLVGKILHNIVLDRYCMGRNLRYAPSVEWCGLSRATKEGKALAPLFEQWQSLMAEADGAQRVPPVLWDKANALADALTGVYTFGGKVLNLNPKAAEILTYAVDTEKAFTYTCPKFNVPIRGFIDLVGRAPDGALYTADLKSLRSVDGKSLRWAIRDSGYDLQAYLYTNAVTHLYGEPCKDAYLLCVGEELHSNTVKFTDLDLIAAKQTYIKAMRCFADCVLDSEIAGAPTPFLKSYTFGD